MFYDCYPANIARMTRSQIYTRNYPNDVTGRRTLELKQYKLLTLTAVWTGASNTLNVTYTDGSIDRCLQHSRALSVQKKVTLLNEHAS